MISPLFTTIVLAGAFIWIFMKVSSKKSDLNTESFLERERLANNTRKQSLDDLNYISLDITRIPVRDNEQNNRILSLLDSIKNLSDKKIVNLTGISNTDLKFQYGVSNLPALTEYDQNFTILSRALFDLGQAYDSEGEQDMAIMCLQYAVDIGTDISGTYTLLAELYIKTGHKDQITSLLISAESIKSITRNSTISKLNDMLDGSYVIPLNEGNSDNTDYVANLSNEDISLSDYSDTSKKAKNTSSPYKSHNSGAPSVDKDMPEYYDSKNSGNILPKDILDILDEQSDISPDQKQ